MKTKLMLAWILSLCLLLIGCSGRILMEDRNNEGLPVLDPEDGVAKDISVVLYYRLTGEAYLVPITRNISVRANERAETAIIRTLLEGVPQQSLSNNVSGMILPWKACARRQIPSAMGWRRRSWPRKPSASQRKKCT